MCPKRNMFNNFGGYNNGKNKKTVTYEGGNYKSGI